MAYVGKEFGPLTDGAGLSDDEIAEILKVLVSSEGRVQCLDLAQRRLWIKRQGSKIRPPLVAIQAGLAALLRIPFLRPSPRLSPEAMQAREIARMNAFASRGFPVPEVLYASRTAMVMTDVGLTLQQTLKTMRQLDPAGHDALMVKASGQLGRVHAAGLSHGRPHVRDFFLREGEIGFMDFEEDPAAVMPLAMAQARDVLLYFLVVSSTATDPLRTCPQALEAWCAHAPVEAKRELRSLTRTIGRILPLARLIGRLHMGSDLRRFIMATEFLTKAPLG